MHNTLGNYEIRRRRRGVRAAVVEQRLEEGSAEEAGGGEADAEAPRHLLAQRVEGAMRRHVQVVVEGAARGPGGWGDVEALWALCAERLLGCGVVDALGDVEAASVRGGGAPAPHPSWQERMATLRWLALPLLHALPPPKLVQLLSHSIARLAGIWREMGKGGATARSATRSVMASL